jgi:Tol biopolymer transport system component
VRGPVGGSDIYVSNDTGGATFCAACTSCDESDPSFSPDASYLVYQSGCSGGYDILRYTLSSGATIHLSSTSGYDEREPHYSPDGRTIVYQRLPSGESRNSSGDIRIMNTDGSNDRSLGLTGRHPVFSPDGRSLAYMSDISGRWQIYIYNLDTFSSQQLTSCAINCRWPAWSPDGRYIIYNLTVSASSMDPDGIEIIPSSGGSPTTLIRDEACGRPTWSESGWIAFNSPRGIEVIQPGGSNRTLLINFTDAWAPDWSR